MTTRQRKFVGAIAMIAFVILYALVVTALVPRMLLDWPAWGQALFYLVAGLAWVVPLLPMIRWMERRDENSG